MKKRISLITLFLSFFFMFGFYYDATELDPVAEISLENINQIGEHNYSCCYKEMERYFSVYLPDTKPKGIIMMLHGYGASNDGFRLDTKMDDTANRRGYAVVYVKGYKNSEDRTAALGWNSGLSESTVDDIGFLKSLATYFQTEYDLNKENTFAVGFSNGGFMAYRIAVEADDCFSAVASVSGMMPESVWKKRKEVTGCSLIQINGTKDDAVPMKLNGSSEFTEHPAIEDVIDYFAAGLALRDNTQIQLSDKADLNIYEEDEMNNKVWFVLIKDGRHGWPDNKYCGFDVNSLILDFFDSLN